MKNSMVSSTTLKSTARRFGMTLERRKWLAVVCVGMLAFGIRAATAVSLSSSIYGAQLMPDEQIYDHYARSFREGKHLPAIVGFSAHVPGYVFSIAYSLLGTDPNSARALNVLLGGATILVLYFGGAALSGWKTGLIAATLGALYGPFILASATAEKTALALFLLSLAMFFGVRAASRQSPLDIALFGIAIALSTHVRGNALAVVIAAPLAFAGIWLRREGLTLLTLKLLAYGASVAIVLVPLSSEGLLGATEHGFNLYLGNNLDNPTPYYRPARFAPSQPSLQGGGFVLRASIATGETLSVAEARDYYASELFRTWRTNPELAFAKALAKFFGSFHIYEHAHNHNIAFVSQFVTPLGFPWVGFGLIFPLAILGIATFWRNAAGLWLMLAAAAYWATLVVFYSDVRLRAPLALLLMPHAAIGIQNMAGRRGRSLAKAAVVVAVAAGASRWPVPGAGDLTTAYNLHALMLLDSGDYDGAERYYDMSSKLAGLDSESAFLGLSVVAAKRNDLARAEALANRVPDAHYKAAEKYVQLASIFIRRQRLEDAANALEQAVEINPGLLPVYPLLEAAYHRLGRVSSVRQIRRRYEYAAKFFD